MKQLRTKEGLPDIENLRTKASVKVMPVVDFLLLPKLFQKSRMMGDYQVRFCEGLGGKFPGSTRRKKLLSDGSGAYEKYVESREDEVVHAQCWVHARRKFVEAKEYAPPECEKVLFWIADLFQIEKALRGEPPDEVLSRRREYSVRIVYEIFEYLDELWFEGLVDKKSPLGQAVSYTRNLKKGLTVFLDHADIPLSNNELERTIRTVAVGRKNWLFFWTEIGAKYAAMAFTLIESCKRNDINPWDYIIDVLQRVDSHPAREVAQITPKYWKDLIAVKFDAS